MTIDELIAALEKATGPSRESEIAILTLIGLTPKQEAHCKEWCRQEDGRTDLTKERYIAAWAPPYTRSLDAALTLVPEGFTVEIQMWPGHPSTVTILGTRWEPFGEKREMAHVHHSVDGRWEASAATPATAVCIAALKARKK